MRFASGRACAFYPVGHTSALLASGGEDCTTRLWDTRSRKVALTLSGGYCVPHVLRLCLSAVLCATLCALKISVLYVSLCDPVYLFLRVTITWMPNIPLVWLCVVVSVT